MNAQQDYDIVMMGHISKDIIVFEGSEELVVGGPVAYSSAAAARAGARILVVTRCAPEDRGHLNSIGESGAKVQVLDSAATTSIRNVYHSADRERRTVTLLSRADSFTVDEIPEFSTKIFYFAGLFVGELPDALIVPAAQRADVALDVQGVLRTEEKGSLIFRDWAGKDEYLPHIAYLKADAAEAEILTGTDDREKAAHMLGEMGAREVMITHHTEVIVGAAGRIYRAPLRPRNLSGRTGRGDTCFAAYLARRLRDGIQDSLGFAAALVSMKMEAPGVFTGSIADVRARMQEDA
ncbi:MAG: carbohydrate kinase [Spirochaetaceae bacterium]|nr:carbohydrate kinase [Spirochaetaceae bacterium]